MQEHMTQVDPRWPYAKQNMETWGIEPQTSSMRSKRSTTELRPLVPSSRKRGSNPRPQDVTARVRPRAYETYALAN